MFSVVCPAFSYGYNRAYLNSINISRSEYTGGAWRGNSSLDEKTVFMNATYNIQDIIHTTNIKFVNGEKKLFNRDTIKSITTFEE